ncbi:MAG: chemotaxis protein [bacterium]|nr:chemotaxis protein [bacterium]
MESAAKHDERTLRVGSNKMELLEFQIEKPGAEGELYHGVYGINVSKVMEVIRMPELTEIPNAPPFMLGLVQLRGKTIPIISLALWMGIPETARDNQNDKIIVTEFNNTSFGFVVHRANRIRRIAWDVIQLPPEMVNEKFGGNITGTTVIEDDRLLLMIDLERIVADLSPKKEDAFTPPVTTGDPDAKTRRILVADDSVVARKQIQTILSKGNFEIELVIDGRKAWHRLEEYYTQAREEGLSIRDLVHVVLTDVEMPEMDGYTLTRKIKNDDRFKVIPVIMHSSMSGESNVARGKEAGCDVYVVKFDPELLFKTVSAF